MDGDGAWLLFVYNADGGMMQALRDAVHMAVSPGMYGCSLCVLTYGILRRRRWRAVVDGVRLPAAFIHREEFRERYGEDVALPAVFFERGGELSLLLSAEEIDGCATLDELMALVAGKMAELPMRGP